jgi:hypothetical protein
MTFGSLISGGFGAHVGGGLRVVEIPLMTFGSLIHETREGALHHAEMLLASKYP